MARFERCARRSLTRRIPLTRCPRERPLRPHRALASLAAMPQRSREQALADLGRVVVDAFERVSGDVDAIHAAATGRPLSAWKKQQAAWVSASAVGSALLPGAHVLAMTADIGFLMNRMHTTSYGVGSIVTRAREALEPEDFANVLAHWSGTVTLDDQLRSAVVTKLSATAGLTVGGGLGSKLVGKAVAEAGTVLIGKKLGAKVAAKVAVKMATKLMAKASAGFVPLIGAAASAGISAWFVTSLADAAEEYYRFKLSVSAPR